MIDETSQAGTLDKAVSQELKTLLTHQDLRQQLASKIRQLARPEASAVVAAMIRDTFYGVCRRDLLAA